jgi:hypothetical protein
MNESTEIENKVTLDSFVDARLKIADEAHATPGLLRAAPQNTLFGRLDGSQSWFRVTGYRMLMANGRRFSDSTYQSIAVGLRLFTIMFDNGREFAEYQEVASALNTDCCFARPYFLRERGTNENTNGLIRQYLPKSRKMYSLGTNLLHLRFEFKAPFVN